MQSRLFENGPVSRVPSTEASELNAEPGNKLRKPFDFATLAVFFVLKKTLPPLFRAYFKIKAKGPES